MNRRHFIKTGLIFVPTWFCTNGIGGNVSLSALDPEAWDWMGRVTGNGGNYTSLSVVAQDTFFKIIKAGGVRPLIYHCNNYLGTGLLSCAVPAIKDKGNTVDTMTNFVAGDYSESTGLTGNGTSKHIDTGLNLLSHIPSVNSLSLAAYIRTNTQESKITMGAVTSGNSSSLAYLYIRDTSNIRKGVACAENGARADGTSSLGLWHVSRTSSSLIKLYNNGASLASDTGGSGTLPNLSVFVHAWNDSSGGAQNYSNRPLGCYMIGAGFNDAQSAVFYNACQTAQTIVARQV